MKGYKKVGHAVLDYDMRRLCYGDRQFCENMIERMGWRNTTLVAVYKPKPKLKKIKVVESAPKKKLVIKALHSSGTEKVFENSEEAGKFFGVLPKTIFSAIARRRASENGPMKNWILYESEE